jgi:hypothetical protein
LEGEIGEVEVEVLIPASDLTGAGVDVTLISRARVTGRLMYEMTDARLYARNVLPSMSS